MGAKEERDWLPRATLGQRLLFPKGARAACKELGLNWWAAQKLHEDGFLSFNPETTNELDEGQEAELLFLGALVAGDCDRQMLEVLLTPLEKPYRYSHGQIYYDWSEKLWKMLPLQEEPEEVFATWLDTLAEDGDVDTLGSLRDDISSALDSIEDEGE